MEFNRNGLGEETPQMLSQRLGLEINDWLLLSRALTHRSYLNEHPEALEDNERLEFLGDAVLDFLVGAWLYNHFPEMAEGELTRMRSALVHTEQLAEFARNIGLGQAMRLGRGEVQAGCRERSAVLCDTFEAVIGAIYLNLGIEAVENFITPFLEKASDEIILNRKNEDPKSRLQEWAQAQGYSTPDYSTIGESGPEHEKIFSVQVSVNGIVYGVGTGHNKQAATKAAAIAALTKLNILEE